MRKWILPFALLIVFEAVADILAKTWSLDRKLSFAASALIAYAVGNLFWLFALKNGTGLGRGAVLFSVLSAILAVIIGLIFYKEPATKLQIFGMALGIVAVALIFWD